MVEAASITEYQNDGFESNNLSAWTTTLTSNGTVTVQSAIKHHGSYAAKHALSASANAYATIEKDFGASSYTTLYARCYIRVSALPASGHWLSVAAYPCNDSYYQFNNIHIYNDGGTMKWWVRYTTNGYSAHDIYNTPAGGISADTWYCIEGKTVVAAGTGAVQWWVNGTEVFNVTSLTNNGDASSLTKCLIDFNSDAALAVDCYSDCAIFASAYIGLDLSTYTKTFTANGNLTKSFAKTFTSNARLLKSFTKTFTGNASLLQTLTKTLSANTNLTSTLTKTFTSNASLTQTLTNQLTANAQLLAQLTKALNLNAELLAATKTFTSNANLTQNLTKTTTANASLTGTLIKTLSVNATLLQALGKTASANANLAGNLTKLCTVNASINQTMQKTITANAQLKTELHTTLTTNAEVTSNLLQEFTINAELQESGIHTFTLNSTILQGLTTTFTMGATLASAPTSKTASGHNRQQPTQQFNPALLKIIKTYLEMKLTSA